MSNILVDLNMKKVLDKTLLVKHKLGNGKIALCLRLKDSLTQVIVREFSGEYQLRRFMYEAVFLRNSVKLKDSTLKDISSVLSSFSKFLDEKDKENVKKIV